MCDFDITSFREKSSTAKTSDSGKEESSFALFMKKRKMLGLDDTDSDSDDDNKETVDALKKRRWQENNDNTKKSAPPAPPVEKSSTMEVEQVASKQDFVAQVDSETATSTPQQQPTLNTNQSPIVLVDDEPTVVKRNDTTHIIDGLDLTKESPPRQKKPRPSNTVSLDIEDLDPELANLFTQEIESTGDTPRPEIVPQKVQIKVSYVSLMETIDANVQSIIDALAKPVKIIMLNNSPFDTLMEQYCRKKRLAMQEMVLVYDNVPVVLRATPSSLSMSTTSTNKMEVYKRSDFEKKMEMEKEIRAARLSHYNDSTSGDEYDQDENEEAYNNNSNEQADLSEEDFLHIKLRGKDNKDIGLRVKPTTQIESIVKQYIRIMELDMALLNKIQLSFEGETLTPSMTIADTDLEDEDMVSVIIHS
ncbi:ubiquitin-2 like Rad60 SUMO-like-domain-containing protein [Absidia repens]|uniref:Ubiquitin-2 like Rad60 SUMO-like-domain-containing protein n=1 Tax=Absidia repens TaxID=90262 RepID=A0A1X2J1Y4_9FUNG|nr:ubiquitin-2 like Rad60 SUMO-like-domain-containing protein [Absidia repens]